MLIAGLLAFSACKPDPLREEAPGYVTRMEPVLVDNMALSRAYLDLAGRIRKESLGADAVATALDGDLLPKARALAAEARRLEPTAPELAAPHRVLVEAWTARADAYADLSRSYHADDLSGFDHAAQANLEAHEDESAYFSDINGVLAPLGLQLVPLP